MSATQKLCAVSFVSQPGEEVPHGVARLKESRGLSLKPMSASSHSEPCLLLRLRTREIKSPRQLPLYIYLHFTVHFCSWQWEWITEGSPGSPPTLSFFYIISNVNTHLLTLVTSASCSSDLIAGCGWCILKVWAGEAASALRWCLFCFLLNLTWRLRKHPVVLLLRWDEMCLWRTNTPSCGTP